MKAGDEVRVYLGVFNFEGSADVVTSIAGLQPTRTWLKGEPSGEGGGIRTHSRWELASPAGPSAPFEAQLGALLDLLEPVPDQVRRVASDFDAGVMVSAKYCATINPSLHVSEAAISRLAGLGLSLDFDLYYLAESPS